MKARATLLPGAPLAPYKQKDPRTAAAGLWKRFVARPGVTIIRTIPSALESHQVGRLLPARGLGSARPIPPVGNLTPPRNRYAMRKVTHVWINCKGVKALRLDEFFTSLDYIGKVASLNRKRHDRTEGEPRDASSRTDGEKPATRPHQLALGCGVLPHGVLYLGKLA